MVTTERPIVVGIDGSEHSGAATRWAVTEARLRGVPLRLVHAFEPAMATEWSWQLDTDVPDLRTMADELIAEAVIEARAYAGDVIDVTGEVLVGHPSQALRAESEEAVLLALGSRRLGPGRPLLGSVSAAVAARAGCPVVVVRGPDGEGTPGPVVAGVDGTSNSDHVLEFAFAYAARRRAPVRAVLCWHPHPLVRTERIERATAAELERGRSRLDELVAPWGRKYRDVVAEQQVLERHPIEALVEQSADADLVVVGARGRHAVTGTLLGSVSQGVVHHADCAVAVVHRHRS